MPVRSELSTPSSRAAVVISDAAVVVGALAFSFGFWLAWHPLGFIVGGLAVLALGILFGRSLTRDRR